MKARMTARARLRLSEVYARRSREAPRTRAPIGDAMSLPDERVRVMSAMNELRICCLSLLVLAACGDDSKTPNRSGPAGQGKEDAAISTAGDASSAGDDDAGAIESDAGCRPAGSPCVEAADMLTCCSRRCGPNASTQTGVCN